MTYESRAYSTPTVTKLPAVSQRVTYRGDLRYPWTVSVHMLTGILHGSMIVETHCVITEITHLEHLECKM